jgi:hypothetical protein
MNYFLPMGAVVGVTLKGWLERDGAFGAGLPASVSVYRSDAGVTMMAAASNHTRRGAVRFR